MEEQSKTLKKKKKTQQNTIEIRKKPEKQLNVFVMYRLTILRRRKEEHNKSLNKEKENIKRELTTIEEQNNQNENYARRK